MAASIPGHIASSLISRLQELEGRLVPFIREVVDKSTSEAFDIAHDTAKGVLDDAISGLEELKATVEQHAPTSGR